ncbi:MAG: Ldh family oxidoreductase [Anaerolineae bacterium]|nr:Ldh family oxidoreductase [Anaerolineae bacterium]
MADTRVKAEALKRFTQDVFVAAGLAPEAAEIEAEVLVWANLRGVDSHGVLRIPQYLASVEAGGHNVNPNIRVEKETAATLLIEADHAFGPVVTVFAMNRAIEKARTAGIGWAAIRNTTHQGAMAYYALMAAKQDMAGIAVVCSPPNMAPTGAKAAGVHNSPIAIAVPGKDRNPLCLDMATSVAAGGKVNLATDKGVPIPLGWALNAEGEPTTDPNQARILLPAGGYKGYAMALMFETLASLMVGNPLVETALLKTGPIQRGTQNSFVAAVNIAAFTDVDEYKAHVDGTIAGLKGLPKAEGYDEILVPGEPENRVYAERSANGIPLPDGTVRNLRAVAAKLNVTLPEGL